MNEADVPLLGFAIDFNFFNVLCPLLHKTFLTLVLLMV